MAETLADIGEFGLIARIANEAHTSPEMALALQDDAALWQQGNSWLIATTDALVEDVDFRLCTFGWEDIGWKALAVNLSDIAAMGGTARCALVTLCLPAGIQVAAVTAFYRGMSLLAEETQTPIVGGDLSSSAQVMANVTVIGEVEDRDRVLRRSTARPGDLLAVTGTLGSAGAGFALLEQGTFAKAAPEARFIAAQRRPEPRLRGGRALIEAGVRCGMDISDGLVADLQKLCNASGVAGEVLLHSVPTDPAIREVLGDSYRTKAVTSGEDFELLFAAPRETMRRARKYLQDRAQLQSTVIGAIVPGRSGSVTVRDEQGRAVPVTKQGFDHFGVGENTRAGE